MSSLPWWSSAHRASCESACRPPCFGAASFAISAASSVSGSVSDVTAFLRALLTATDLALFAWQLTPGTALLGKERCPAPAVRTDRQTAL